VPKSTFFVAYSFLIDGGPQGKSLQVCSVFGVGSGYSGAGNAKGGKCTSLGKRE
jgi:hypothetical protein